MVSKGPDAELQFSRPIQQITTMMLVLGLVAAGGYLAYPQVAPVFLANPYLNGFIIMVFVIGVLACFWQVITLVSSVGWIEGFAQERPGHDLTVAPRLLAPLATLLRSRGRMQLSSSSTQSILDSVATRVDEAREITRYIVNMLIFLGLLGTFYGLATTVPAVVDTIRSLAPQEGEGGVEVFNRLMTGLEAQLGGMGVAFASSLLGLAGSLVVGLLELFAGQAQNRFYRELEEWLSTITRVGVAGGEEGSGDAGLMAQVIDNLSEQLENVQHHFIETGIDRQLMDDRMGQLATAVENMAQQMSQAAATDPTDVLTEGQSRLIEAQEEMVAGQAQMTEMQADFQARLLTALTGQTRDDELGGDPEARMRLRSMDTQMLQILEEISAGRQELLADLRVEIGGLTQAIRAATGQDGS